MKRNEAEKRVFSKMNKKSYLSDTHPELCLEWYDNNLSPSDITAGSEKKVKWICLKHTTCNQHIYESPICTRTGPKKTGCPYCINRKVCICNALSTTHPELCREWHPSNKMNPSEISAGSNRKVKWICLKHTTCEEHIYEISPTHRTSIHATGCPFCVNQKVCICNALSTTHPKLCLEWHNDNVMVPSQITAGSNKKVKWICLKHKTCDYQHVFETAPAYRTGVHETGCPYCSNRKVCVCNALSTTHPELCFEWHPDNTLKPSDITAGSNKKVKWICLKHITCNQHVYETMISLRGVKKTGCPYCSNQKICACNALSITHPELCKTWHPDNLLKPSETTAGSHKKVKWMCIKCKYNWITSIADRAKKHLPSGCPQCAFSKMQTAMKEVLIILETKNIIKTFIPEWTLPNTQLRADFMCALNDGKQIFIETDGIQHFEATSFGATKKTKEEMFQNVQRLDALKKKWCEENNIRLLRLSYLVLFEHYEIEVLTFISDVNVSFRLVGLPVQVV